MGYGGYTAYIPDGGNGSLVANGQILPVPMDGQFYPATASAPFYRGTGQPPPTVPLNYMQNPVQINQSQSELAAADPWNFFDSPVWISLIALFAAIIWLRYIHWRH